MVTTPAAPFRLTHAEVAAGRSPHAVLRFEHPIRNTQNNRAAAIRKSSLSRSLGILSPAAVLPPEGHFKPPVGDRRRPSKLTDNQPTDRPAQYTTGFFAMLRVLPIWSRWSRLSPTSWRTSSTDRRSTAARFARPARLGKPRRRLSKSTRSKLTVRYPSRDDRAVSASGAMPGCGKSRRMSAWCGRSVRRCTRAPPPLPFPCTLPQIDAGVRAHAPLSHGLRPQRPLRISS